MNFITKRLGNIIFGVLSVAVFINAQQAPGTWKNVTPHVLDSIIRNGGSWSGIQYVLADPARQSDLWASGDYLGTWKSTDYGLTWTHINTGANAAAIDRGRQWSQAIDLNPDRTPSTPPALYTTLGYGTNAIWKSTDGGVNWTNIWSNNIYNGTTNISTDVGDDMARVQIVDPTDPDHLIAYLHSYWGTGNNNGIFESTNGGVTWLVHPSQQFSFQPHADGGFALDSRTWIVIHGTTWPNNQLYRTTDAGTTWSVVANNLPMTNYNNANPLKVAPNTYYMPGNPVLKTTDAGATWTRITAAGNCGAAMCLTQSNRIYIVTANSGNDVNFKFRHMSVGNDAVWTDDPVPHADSLYWGPGNNGSINCAYPGVLATTFDGTHVIIVGSCAMSGVWRYVEPGTTGMTLHTARASAVSLTNNSRISMAVTDQKRGLKTGSQFSIRGERIAGKKVAGQAIVIR